jgi:CHAT domain-containing protein
MLVSQWKVNSASTSELMMQFYRSLESNQDRFNAKANALREAAQKILKDDRYRHPFYWGAFGLVGSD